MSEVNSRRERGRGPSLYGYPSSAFATRRHLLPQGENEDEDAQFGPNMNLPSPSRYGPVRM
jgi:hypothetical protein